MSKNVSAENYEKTNSQNMSMEFDGSDLLVRQDYHAAEKFDNGNVSVELTNDISNSVSTDGTLKSSAAAGRELKTENLEVGAKVSASSISSEDSEEQSMGIEASGGVKLAEGMKLKNTVNMQYSNKFSETEEKFIEEETESIAFQSRIEVDSEKATLGKKAAAGIYNTGMKVAETGINGMLTTSSQTVTAKEDGEKKGSGEEKEEFEQEALIQEEQELRQMDVELAEVEERIEHRGEDCDYYYGMGY